MNVLQKLRGLHDARSSRGILARGKNVYNGGSSAAHRGGGNQYGRPKKGSYKEAAMRRMRKYGKS